MGGPPRKTPVRGGGVLQVYHLVIGWGEKKSLEPHGKGSLSGKGRRSAAIDSPARSGKRFCNQSWGGGGGPAWDAGKQRVPVPHPWKRVKKEKEEKEGVSGPVAGQGRKVFK